MTWRDLVTADNPFGLKPGNNNEQAVELAALFNAGDITVTGYDHKTCVAVASGGVVTFSAK